VTSAKAGGWHGSIEHATDSRSDRPRFTDVRLDRPLKREAVIVEIWDWFDDLGSGIRGFDGKVIAARRDHAARELAGSEPWHVAGLIVVRATARNRKLVREFAPLFRSHFPGSSRSWLVALTNPEAAMPRQAGFLWTDVRGTRLFAARF
jgi:hypothetical protein